MRRHPHGSVPRLFLCDVSFREISGDFFVGEAVVHEVAGEVLVVGCHVYQTMSGEVEQDDLAFSGFLAFKGLTDGGGYRVA